MLGRWFGGQRDGDEAQQFEPHMPEVDVIPNLEELFARARQETPATDQGNSPPRPPGRYVLVVTPGRMLMVQPCPAPGSMPAAQVASIEKLVPPAVKRNIAAIASTELAALRADPAKAIPFLGMLLGCAYVGHTVWVFEGHESALAAGCRNADVLIVDGGMAPYLASGWQQIAAGTMRHREIYLHDRANFALRRVALA